MASTRRRHQPLSIEEALSRVSTAAETIKLRESVKPHESKRIREAFNLLEQLPVENGEKRGHYRHFLKKVNEKCGPQMVVICVVGLGQSTITNMKEYARLRLPLEIKKRHQALKDRVLDSIVETHRVKVPRNTSAHLESQSPLNLQASQYTDCVADAQPPQSTLTQQPPLKSGSQFTREQAYNKHLGHLEQSLSTIPSTGAGVQETIRQQPQGHKASSLYGRVFQLLLGDVQTILMSGHAQTEVFLTEPYDKQNLPFITITLSRELGVYFSTQRRQVM